MRKQIIGKRLKIETHWVLKRRRVVWLRNRRTQLGAIRADASGWRGRGVGCRPSAGLGTVHIQLLLRTRNPRTQELHVGCRREIRGA